MAKNTIRVGTSFGDFRNMHGQIPGAAQTYDASFCQAGLLLAED
jgi:hypothetical protein